jgi:hypothetical protein
VSISIPIEALKTGKVLAAPVFNRAGQILLGKGVKISHRHLTILKTWGIQTVSVENGGAEAPVPLPSGEILSRAQDRINKRLLWHPSSPLEEEIIHLAIRQTVQRSLQPGS